jgi:hypothetical protein
LLLHDEEYTKMELVNIGLVMLVSCFVELDMKMMLDLDPIV